ncbi:MAG: prolyl oligopeptidase family serine peptidase [Sinobacteraceae bacterium]|nr:prolyl oligopeptidase family serine peptidase [Nevskiaceae bacterium]
MVVLCHGYGADGNDLIGLAPVWQKLLPTVAFAAPNAPERCAGSPGYQWFPISRLDPHAMNSGVHSAAAGLEGFLEAELARNQLPDDRLALVGFSQGTMMSLHAGLHRKVKPAAIIGYSGMLTNTEGLGQCGPEAPPILLVHGDADQMIPAQFLFSSATALGHAGAAVQWHICPQLGHSIDEKGLVLGGTFLAMAFRGLLRRTAAEICCSVT